MHSKGGEENEGRSGTRLVSGPFIGACRRCCAGSLTARHAVGQEIASGRRPRGHRPSPQGGVRRTREPDAKASNSSHFPAGYRAVPSDLRFHRWNQLLCRTADSRPQPASIADMGCALFGIECLTLSSASLAGWIANRCLRAAATRYGVGIAFLLLRLPSAVSPLLPDVAHPPGCKPDHNAPDTTAQMKRRLPQHDEPAVLYLTGGQQHQLGVPHAGPR